jgi:hypothetical protein
VILHLLAATGAEEFVAAEGRFVADRLPPFIARVRNLLHRSTGQPGWDADARGATRLILSDALSTFGEQSGQNQPLEEAVTVYQEALQDYTRERLPLQWTGTQNNLGKPSKRWGSGRAARFGSKRPSRLTGRPWPCSRRPQASYYIENTRREPAAVRSPAPGAAGGWGVEGSEPIGRGSGDNGGPIPILQPFHLPPGAFLLINQQMRRQFA